MINALDICFICNGTIKKSTIKHYLKCGNCGHEIIGKDIGQKYIINDVLARDKIERLSYLDRFKINTMRKFLTSDNNFFLLDIGSAAGRFLFHCKKYFKHVAGLEVTEKCLLFSRNVLGLRVEKIIENIKEPISFVTCWHSLEHIPPKSLEEIFTYLAKNTTDECIVLISVPNNNSLQYRLFRENYPYYDLPNHIHQFSPLSLRMFMERFGFQEEKGPIFSFSYAFFGYLQGILNYCNRIPNYLYYRKKRGLNFSRAQSELLVTDIYNYALTALFLMPSLFLAFTDVVWKKHGGVLTVCYKKKRP